jgi:hypothetical protein
VSWGDDGAIRFWEPAGERRGGGALDAHVLGVDGVLPFGDGIVSWASGRRNARLGTHQGDCMNLQVTIRENAESMQVLSIRDEDHHHGRHPIPPPNLASGHGRGFTFVKCGRGA